MNIMGCDLHSRYQVVAWVEEETGEILTRRLEHENGEAQAFYANWPRGAVVGIEPVARTAVFAVRGFYILRRTADQKPAGPRYRL